MATGVAFGAFGAHALKDAVSPGDLQIWEKAVLYQLVHGVSALVLTSSEQIIPRASNRSRAAALMLTSVCIFSGTLYLLVLTGHRWLGMITPIGGMGFILSWLYVAFQVLRPPLEPRN